MHCATYNPHVMMNRLAELTNNFGANLKPHDIELFESSTLQDMKRDLNTIQSKQYQTDAMMNMNRIDMLLNGMEELDKMFSAVNSSDRRRHTMAYVWGSIWFLLTRTSPTAKAFDNVLDTYKQLGVHMPELSNHAAIFQEFPDSRECLVNIYEDVQRFHLLAYKLFSLRPKLWQRLYRCIWKDLSHTFEQISKSLKAHKIFIEKCSIILQSGDSSVGGSHFSDEFDRYRGEVEKIWKDFKETETERKRTQKANVQHWISASNKTEEMHKGFQKTRICSRSGRWLFRSYGQVTDWMKEHEPPESAIWLHGNKGFGKTILSSLIVDELRSLSTEEKGYMIPADSKTYYFYCQEGDDEYCTHLGILKGVLCQMVDSDDYLLPLCEEKRTHSRGDHLDNVETAQTLVEAFVEQYPRQYIVIDGLDECEIIEARRTAEFFMSQINICDNEFNQGQLRVLFMSQPMPGMRSQMPEDDASIPLKPVDNAEDIKSYVQKRIPEFSECDDSRTSFNLSEADKEQMESIICQQNMFLYTHLAIEYLLQQQTKGDLLDKIKDEMLPEKLSDIYEKLLETVKARLKRMAGGEAFWEKAKILLGWLVCAKRPLKWHEMQSITSFDPENGTIDFDNRMLRHNVHKYMGSFVHVLDGGHIRLIHSTARRHIVNNNHINEEEVQCKLTVLCLRYLSLHCFVDGYQDQERIEKAKLGWFSFQDYACAHWYNHIDTILKKCNDFRYSNALGSLATALQIFVDTHGPHLTQNVHSGLEREEIDKFQNFPFYHNLFFIWNHIFTHQKGGIDARNKVGIKQIDEALTKNRSALENNFLPSDNTVHNDTIKDYYGPNLFKCERTLCNYFHVGYDSEKARDNHHNRHNRPYPCPVAECKMTPLGFALKKDKERHVRQYHSELTDRLSDFNTPSNGEQGGFTCSICSRTFTRNANLRGHERSHFGERPYRCSTCNKPFTSSSDCRRHEKIHARRRAGA